MATSKKKYPDVCYALVRAGMRDPLDLTEIALRWRYNSRRYR
jgi:hypothetical protein